MTPEIISIIVGLIIAWLVFTWALKVLKASLSTAIAIAILLFILQQFFGIHYLQLWETLVNYAQQFISQFLSQ